MNKKSISAEGFFRESPEVVARNLIGKVIVLPLTQNKKKCFIIKETEAYDWDDKDSNNTYICYGRRYNRTKKSEPLFGTPGTWCIYGRQLLLSVHEENKSDNVLIKRIIDNGQELGPEGIAEALHLSANAEQSIYDQCHNRLWNDCPVLTIEDAENAYGFSIATSSRIGIKNSDKKRFTMVVSLY